MAVSESEAEAMIAREYVEALHELLMRVSCRFPAALEQTLTHPLRQYVAIAADKLGVGSLDAVDGLERFALLDALHALQHVGCYVDRARQARCLSGTHYSLIRRLHRTSLEQIQLVLRDRTRSDIHA